MNKIRKPMSDETKQKISDKLKVLYADPNVRQELSIRGKRQYADPAVRAAASERALKIWMDNNPCWKPKEKKSLEYARKQRSNRFKQMHADGKMTYNNHTTPHTKESKKRMSESIKRAYAEGRKFSPTVSLTALQKEVHALRLSEWNYGGFWYGAVTYRNPRAIYCEKWTPEFRERVRAFFEYRCVECGNPQNGKKLHVHHVWYNKNSCCDDKPRSFVALCHSCHSRTQPMFKNTEYWSNHFQEIIDNIYDSKCYLSKEEFAAIRASH